MNARLRQLGPVSVLAGLLSCGGDMENAKKAFATHGDETCVTTSRTRESSDKLEADSLNGKGFQAIPVQADSVASQPIQPRYAEQSAIPRLIRLGFSIPGELLKMG